MVNIFNIKNKVGNKLRLSSESGAGFIPHLFYKSLTFFIKKVRDKKGEEKGLPLTFSFKKGEGFTLIELVIVLAIFFIIVSVTVSIFVSVTGQQKKILTEQELLNQVNYIVEYMSRQGRMAKLDSSGSCLGNSFINYYYRLTRYEAMSGFYQGIKFISSDNNCYEFFLGTDGVLKEIKNGAPAQILLSNKFKVNYARFIINGNKTLQGAMQNNLIQPRITMSLNVKLQISPLEREKIFQTTISQRNLNQF